MLGQGGARRGSAPSWPAPRGGERAGRLWSACARWQNAAWILCYPRRVRALPTVPACLSCFSSAFFLPHSGDAAPAARSACKILPYCCGPIAHSILLYASQQVCEGVQLRAKVHALFLLHSRDAAPAARTACKCLPHSCDAAPAARAASLFLPHSGDAALCGPNVLVSFDGIRSI